jgi:hypothetical protein
MSAEMPEGWYTTPDGTKRYWNGSDWTTMTWDEPPRKRRIPKKVLVLAGSILVMLVLGGGAAAVVAGQIAAREDAAAQAAEEQEQERADAKQKAEAAADQAERESRAATVDDIEASIKKMANSHAKDGLIDRKPIGVSCSPLGGGSTDDLSELTTVFDCFVATKDNNDGTQSGYPYNATMNWSSGEYTYGFGNP